MFICAWSSSFPTDLTVLSPKQYSEGWAFADIDPFPLVKRDPLFGAKRLSDVYFKAEPEYAGRSVMSFNNVFEIVLINLQVHRTLAMGQDIEHRGQ